MRRRFGMGFLAAALVVVLAGMWIPLILQANNLVTSRFDSHRKKANPLLVLAKSVSMILQNAEKKVYKTPKDCIIKIWLIIRQELWMQFCRRDWNPRVQF